MLLHMDHGLPGDAQVMTELGERFYVRHLAIGDKVCHQHAGTCCILAVQVLMGCAVPEIPSESQHAQQCAL